jgi:hypothetical protein
MEKAELKLASLRATCVSYVFTLHPNAAEERRSLVPAKIGNGEVEAHTNHKYFGQFGQGYHVRI